MVALTSSTGVVVQQYAYDSFGVPYVKSGSGSGSSTVYVLVSSYTGSLHENTRLYTSREYDKENSLYFLRARYYSPSTGKFISRDPIGQNDQINLYTYVGNSPMMYVDLRGKEKQAIKVIKITKRFNKTLDEMRIEMATYLLDIPPVDLSIFIPHSLTRKKIGEKLNLTQEQLNMIPDSVLTELEQDALKFKYFYSLVKTGGPWDLKAHDYQDLKDYDKIIYNGCEYRYDDFGNISYGYAGTALGISEETLKVMGGLAQIDAGTSKPEWTFENSYYDDPRDQAMIGMGIQLFNTHLATYEK